MALTKEEIFHNLSVSSPGTITINSVVKVKDGDILLASNNAIKDIQPYAIVDGVVVETDVSGENDLVQKVAAKLWTKAIKDSLKEHLDAVVAE
jgi:hypothetical protein